MSVVSNERCTRVHRSLPTTSRGRSISRRRHRQPARTPPCPGLRLPSSLPCWGPRLRLAPACSGCHRSKPGRHQHRRMRPRRRPRCRRVDHDDAWLGVVRDEGFRPTGVVPVLRDLQQNRLVHRDPTGDAGSAPEWADLTSIEMQMTPTNGSDGVSLYFELAGRRDDEASAAYGLVVDVDGDGLPDYRVGMDNLDGPRHREWISELARATPASMTSTRQVVTVGPRSACLPTRTSPVRRTQPTKGTCSPLLVHQASASTCGRQPLTRTAPSSPTMRRTSAGSSSSPTAHARVVAPTHRLRPLQASSAAPLSPPETADEYLIWSA